MRYQVRCFFVAFAVVIGLGGCAAPDSFVARGLIEVPLSRIDTLQIAGYGGFDVNLLHEGDPCVVASGAEDLGEGGRVTIRNSQGEAIAVGSLGRPVVARGSVSQCVVRFEIEGIPTQDRDVYGLEIGTDRGALNYTKAELEAGIALEI